MRFSKKPSQDRHTTEEIDWMVDGAGTHKTDQDVPYLVGTVTYDPKKKWNSVDFPEGTFTDDNIVVFLTIQNQQAKQEFLALR